jgi:hypothetical protein
MKKIFYWPPLEAALLIPKVGYLLKTIFLGYTNKIRETDTTA